jgi:hypothetical protein
MATDPKLVKEVSAAVEKELSAALNKLSARLDALEKKVDTQQSAWDKKDELKRKQIDEMNKSLGQAGNKTDDKSSAELMTMKKELKEQSALKAKYDAEAARVTAELKTYNQEMTKMAQRAGEKGVLEMRLIALEAQVKAALARK